MINEEDHLRMQSIRSGLQLKQAFKLVDKIDGSGEDGLAAQKVLAAAIESLENEKIVFIK